LLDFRFALVFRCAHATVLPAGLTGIADQKRSPHFGREQEQILPADHGIDLASITSFSEPSISSFRINSRDVESDAITALGVVQPAIR